MCNNWIITTFAIKPQPPLKTEEILIFVNILLKETEKKSMKDLCYIVNIKGGSLSTVTK